MLNKMVDVKQQLHYGHAEFNTTMLGAFEYHELETRRLLSRLMSIREVWGTTSASGGPKWGLRGKERWLDKWFMHQLDEFKTGNWHEWVKIFV